MKLPQFERSWHGVDFRHLPVKLSKTTLANDAFYRALYAKFDDRDVSADWLKEKTAVGEWVERHILQRKIKPRVLSIAAGMAVIERGWLNKGYDVTLNECQTDSLTAVREQFPGVKTLIGNAYDLAISDQYDIISIFTVDYALTDQQMQSMFKCVKGALAPGGIVVSQTVNTLTIRSLFAEFVKRFLLGRYGTEGWQLWGWRRAPDAIIDSAARSGLKLSEQFVHDGKEFRPRRFLRRFPTFQKSNIILTFLS